MAKVFVLQDNPYKPMDFAPAEEFGEVTILFNTHISNHAMPRAISTLRERISANMKKGDWLIPTGNPALIAHAGRIICDVTGELNILVWDNVSQTYVPAPFSMKGKVNG